MECVYIWIIVVLIALTMIRASLAFRLMHRQSFIFQDMIRAKKLELATSYVLNYENSQNPYPARRSFIRQFMSENSSVHIGMSAREKLEPLIQEIMKTGVKVKDASHVASAILLKCDFFLTTDKRLLKYRTDKLEMITPVEFVKRFEEKI